VYIITIHQKRRLSNKKEKMVFMKCTPYYFLLDSIAPYVVYYIYRVCNVRSNVMSLKHGLMGLLKYAPMTGYDLDKAFRESLSFFWKATTSQIYRELDTMERGGWLTSEHIIQNTKPNKRVYSLTETGEEEFAAWLAEPAEDIAGAMSVRSAFLMRVFFSGETSSEQSIVLLRVYHAQCLEKLRGMDAAFDSISQHGESAEYAAKARHWKIAALFGEAYYRAGMEWAEKAIAELEGEPQ
jgi:DNA-binding PadR family transcriptional regulator